MAESSIQKTLGSSFHRAVTLCLLVACLGFGAMLLFSTYRSFTGELHSVSSVIASTSRAALLFDDSDAASRLLDGLRQNESVTNGAILHVDGTPLATLESPMRLSVDAQQRITSAQRSWTLSSLTLVTPVMKDDEHLGFLVVETSLRRFYLQGVLAIVLALPFALLTAAGSAYFRRRLQEQVLSPIMQLSEATRAISRAEMMPEDIVVPDRDDDELKHLFRGFKAMLLQLKERDRALTLAKERAEEADRLKSVFLATVSHELRTPMHAILGMTDEVLESPLSEEQRELLSIVKNSGGQLISIINDILDFSKIEAGKLVLIPVSVELRSFLPQTLRLFELSARRKSISLELEIDPSIPEVLSLDRARLSQVVTNLVGNALKFTLSGRVKVSVRIKDENRSANSVLLHFSVSDTGVGIPEEHLPRIFDSFSQFQAHSHTEGTGLGLAISSKLVGLMGGWIWAESIVGQGSTFHFVISASVENPRQNLLSSALPHAFASVGHEAQSTTAHILVVEDNKVNAKLAQRILEQAGYKVSLVFNGIECLEFLEEAAVDLILMDVQMPQMDGITATRHIREREKLSGEHVPIIAVTANAIDDQVQQCLEVGMDEFLTKPLSKGSLLASIKNYLGRRGETSPFTH